MVSKPDKQTRLTMIDIKADSEKLAWNDPFLQNQVGYPDGLWRLPAGTTLGGQDIGSWVLAQLRDTAGKLVGNVHLHPQYHTNGRMLFAPVPYPTGATYLNPLGEDYPVHFLAVTLEEAWGICRNLLLPAQVVVCWTTRNRRHTADSLIKAGKPVAIVADASQLLALRADDVDQTAADYIDPKLVSLVEVELGPAIAPSFDVDISQPIEQFIRQYLPLTPSDVRALNGGEGENEITFGRWEIDDLFEYVSLIYGTDTCWDALNRVQMRLSHLRHAVGSDQYKLWADSPRRKTIKGLAFSPDGTLPSRHHINLFTGLPCLPIGDNACCDLIFQHIKRLCSNRTNEAEWLMKWLAYPLQNPGAKMDTSVIMYGSEGPGKSILFEQIMGQIYGEYQITIGQAQLESQFTGWQSGKLLAVCEEVVTRTERHQHKGQLKHLVTGKTIMVNEKNMPVREEDNHLNFVFLSNSTVPLELDLGDRRYFVIHTTGVPDQGYFDRLFDEINNHQGVAAFAEYLRHLPLDGFDQHTKPLTNQDKNHLIEVSLPNPLLFFRDWQRGELAIPFVSCAKADLFRAYLGWCRAKNEYPKRDRDFTAELRRHIPEGRHDLRIGGATAKRTTRVWYVGDDPKRVGEPDFVTRLEQAVTSVASAMKSGVYHSAEDADMPI